MPERHKQEDKEVIHYEVVKVGDKWVRKEITTTGGLMRSEDFC